MIIYFTVQDNDFGQEMSYFGEGLINKIYSYEPHKNLKKLNTLKEYEEAFEKIEKHNKMMEEISPNSSKPISSECKEYLFSIIRDLFASHLEYSRYASDPSTIEYLNKNFNVKIVDNFKDEWENGEGFYYITSNNILLNV